MRKKVFLWILTILMIAAFMPITSFGDESDSGKIEGIEQKQAICEGDINPGSRHATDINGRTGELQLRVLAHKKLRTLMNHYADVEYYCHTVDRITNLTETQYGELRQVATAATKDCKTSYEKIKKIYELVAGEVYFDYDYYYGDKSTTYYGYDAWKNKVTICAGYTELCCIFLNAIEIPSAYLNGKNHAYNAAYDIENERWVFFDATWGSENKFRYGKKDKNGYTLDYFDLTVSEIAEFNNHECFFKNIFLLPESKDNSRLCLITPDDSSSWTKLDAWNLSVESLVDPAVENVQLQCTELCGIPVSVIGSRLFRESVNLQTVTLQGSITTIEDSAFYGRTKLECVELPSNVKSIGSYAFRKCTNLREITIPDKVTKIGNYLFADCYNLETVDISNHVTSIGSCAFSNCESLKHITIPKGVTSIGSKAFSNCTDLESVSIPNSVESIENNAFDGCNQVTIYCFAGSYAQEYAEARGLNYETWIELDQCDVSIGQSEYHVALEPTRSPVTVTFGDRVLIEGVHYEVTETEHEIGEVLVTVTGLDNCVGEVVLSYSIVDHQWGDTYIVDREATCTTEGSKSMHCATCGASRDAEIIPATGHSFGEWKSVKVGTCLNSANIQERSCEICGFTEVKSLTEECHDWEESPTVDVPPTCNTDGSESIHCSKCDARKSSTVIPATGHDLIFHEGEPSTCLTEGYAPYYTCSTCDYTSYMNLPLAEHKWSHVIEPPGLLKDGCEYDKCETCGVATISTDIPGFAAYCVKSFKLKKGKKTITAKWKRRGKTVQKQFDGYQIRYSTKASMSGAKKIYASKSSKGKKIKNLKSKTRYYVQVRTYKKKNGKIFYSKWSNWKSVKTK